MSILKPKFVEIEIQQQKMNEAGAKYMVVLSYEPEDKFSKEIISVVLTNNKPKIKDKRDVGDAVLNKNVPTTEKPKPITTPEGLFGE